MKTKSDISGLQDNFIHDLDVVLDRIRAMLIDKNDKYGDSILSPVRVFSKANTHEQIMVRLDDKLSRLVSGDKNDTEDVFLDIIGYLLVNEIAKLRTYRLQTTSRDGITLNLNLTGRK